MKTTVKAMFAGLSFLSLALGWAQQASAGFDIRMDSISTVPDAGNVQEGTNLNIRCNWNSAIPTTKIESSKPVGTGTITVEQTSPVKKVTVIKKVTGLIPKGTYYGAGSTFTTAPPKGIFEASWPASPAGLYKFTCAVSLFEDGVAELGSGTANNLQFRLMTVTQKTQPPPPPSGGKLRSPNARSCASKMDVWLEVDLAGQDPSKVSPGPKKKVTWPIFASQPVLNSVHCSYGTAAANVMYLLKCNNPKKSGQPHTYYCEE